MARALKLARRSVALAHPNPMVGAVLVKNGKVVGEGFHTYERLRHAEIVALERAGDAARGATLYVNLEPCCHQGRTGACTRALLEAGVKRVVAAMPDPNSRVAGKGFRELRRGGLEVATGLRQEEARRLNEDFSRWVRSGLPFVTLKTALTLDGRISGPGGTVTWITSPASRKEVQRMRHAADALLTGIGTVLSDDPRLTDRTGLPRRRRLLRIILDSQLRLPLRSKIVRSADGDVLVFTLLSLESPRARALRRAGVEVARVRARCGRPDLREVLRHLGRREILNLLIEAGAAVNGAALEAGIVNKVVLFYAPRILGGGLPAALANFRSLTAAPKLREIELRRIGPDLVVEGYLPEV